MSYRVNRLNRKNGVTYVYEVTAYWDKEKKGPRNTQVCIGKLDPVSGEFIPSKRLNPVQGAVRDPTVTAATTIIGPALILDQITAELQLDQVLKRAFPQVFPQVLGMAYYLAATGGPLSHCTPWSAGHDHPGGRTMTSQRISEILAALHPDRQKTFFQAWGRQVAERDLLCYDITSVSSYGELNACLKYGYNRDGESLKQVNQALLSGLHCQIPVSFHRLPGNVTDVTTLVPCLEACRGLGYSRLHLVLDRGFYSRRNIDTLLAGRHRFLVAVPGRPTWVRQVIDQVRATIQDPEGYLQVEGEVVYAHTRLYPWGTDRRRCYLHLYFNARAAAAAIDQLNAELLGYRAELEEGREVKEHQEAYQTFFTVKETPVRGRRVSYHHQAIREHRQRYTGFTVLLTNSLKDPLEALEVYRNKDTIEQCFDDLKNQLDMKRWRVHSTPVMDGRFFVQFVALIYLSVLRRKMRETGLLERYTVRELLLEMETLTRIRYSSRYGYMITAITKPQRMIMEALGIRLPT